MGRGSDFSHIPIIDVSDLVAGGPCTRRVMPEVRVADIADQ
jgi:hypothetical protein